MTFPADYAERVYAGVLGKMIGVYLGRPIEGWLHQRILERFGEVRDYVNEAQGRPLVVSDDDLSGTFTFIRAIEEHGPDLTAEDIGRTWLNQIVEGRSILWWGGMGNSTEETAYTRLKHGIPAPQSGSIALNGHMVAEQIGAQIFIDGWAMLCPDDPQRAARLARAAGSVSHDGEAVNAAVALAIMEAMAFSPHTLDELLDAAQASLPAGSLLRQLYQDVRQWHRDLPDWKDAFAQLDEHYGYHRFPGNVHVIPNHGVILLSLLYGNDHFEETLVICNTCGWDTDCNVGNVGALMGLRHGLAALPRRWRAPVADRLFVCSARGAKVVTDAVQVTEDILALARQLHGQPPAERGPRFSFRFPGAVQGFSGEGLQLAPSPSGLRLTSAGQGRATTATFLPPDVPNPIDVPYTRNLGAGWNYTLLASPTLHPGQQLSVHLTPEADLQVGCTLDYYDAEDQLVTLDGDLTRVQAGQAVHLQWTVPDLGCLPIARVGLQVQGVGSVLLHSLDWQGTPTLQFQRPDGVGQMWRRAWINAADRIDIKSPQLMRFTQHQGLGQQLLDAGDWTNLRLEAQLSAILPSPVGIGIHANGLRRHYALLLTPQKAQLIRQEDEHRTVLAEADYQYEPGQVEELTLEILQNTTLRGQVGDVALQAEDSTPLPPGGITILCESGGVDLHTLRMTPLNS